MTGQSLLPEPRSLADDRDGTWVRHWQDPAWVASADAWVADRLREHGIALTGAGLTYKVRFWSVVRCYPTDAGVYWFKENNPGQGFEARLVATLADLVPDLVIRPLATRADAGWLLTADQGATLADSGGIRDQATRLRLVVELADLQRTCVAHEQAVHSAGLTTVAPGQAGAILRTRLTRLADLPDGHPLRPDAALAERVRRAADRLDALAGEFDSRIPLTLDHNDAHAHNVFGDVGTPLRFFDFGDAVWGHPFSTLHSLVNSLPWTADVAVDDPSVATLIRTYLDRWSDLADLDTLRHDYHLASRLQPVTRLVSWHRLLDHADPDEIGAWLETPTYWLNAVAGLAD